MKSFLTDPLLKNNPHKQNKVTVICDCIKIVMFPLFWYKRPSCWLKELWIINPICINKHLLNKACLIRWMKDRKFNPNLNVVIENPIWDKVLKATTFFKSSSIKAVILENIIVKHLILRIKEENLKNKIINLKLNNKINPAVTNVLLWTRDLTGVGALIAFGNHPLKGNCALLVKEVKIRNEIIVGKKKTE